MALLDYLNKIEASTATDVEKKTYYNEVIAERLALGVVPAESDEVGFNMLHWAAMCNQLDEVQKYVNGFKIDVNTRSGKSNNTDTYFFNLTPLYIASLHGYTAIAHW